MTILKQEWIEPIREVMQSVKQTKTYLRRAGDFCMLGCICEAWRRKNPTRAQWKEFGQAPEPEVYSFEFDTQLFHRVVSTRDRKRSLQ